MVITKHGKREYICIGFIVGVLFATAFGTAPVFYYLHGVTQQMALMDQALIAQAIGGRE